MEPSSRAALMDRCFADLPFARTALAHPDWHVRFAAAEAVGRAGDRGALDALHALLESERGQPLYSQPPVRYEGLGDATEIAERVDPLIMSFPSEPDPETREAWRRRGRLKQAALFAIACIGEAGAPLAAEVRRLAAEDGEDEPVRAAACRCLGRIGGAESLPALEKAAAVDEWCTATEARKSIEAIRGRS
jgi:HEAT repeat protein